MKINNNKNSMENRLMALSGAVTRALSVFTSLLQDLEAVNSELDDISAEALAKADYYDKMAFSAQEQILDNKRVIDNINKLLDR